MSIASDRIAALEALLLQPLPKEVWRQIATELAILKLGTGSTDVSALAKEVTLGLLQTATSKSILRQFAPRINFGTQLSASGDSTIVASPGVNTQLVITELILQNHSPTAVTALVKAGSSDPSPIRVRCPMDGSGLSNVYSSGNEIRLPANTALILNLSAAVSFGVSLRYYLENTLTGLPI